MSEKLRATLRVEAFHGRPCSPNAGGDKVTSVFVNKQKHRKVSWDADALARTPRVAGRRSARMRRVFAARRTVL